eukprot:4821313-Heterocapsa_arctica.AAC.1
MKEVDNRNGVITREDMAEDMAGNEEADKLAMLGVEMHKVPVHLEKEVAKQDALVEGLLQMMLN